MDISEAIQLECDLLAQFLLKKNKAYGNSVGDPVKCFSKADAKERIAVRIDDKLSRMMRGKDYPGDDDRLDLLGYLLLERAIDRVEKAKQSVNVRTL